MKKKIKIDNMGIRIRGIGRTAKGDIKINVEETTEGGKRKFQEAIHT